MACPYNDGVNIHIQNKAVGDADRLIGGYGGGDYLTAILTVWVRGVPSALRAWRVAR